MPNDDELPLLHVALSAMQASKTMDAIRVCLARNSSSSNIVHPGSWLHFSIVRGEAGVRQLMSQSFIDRGYSEGGALGLALRI